MRMMLNTTSHRRGQALLLVVLLMMAVVLIGVLFVALIGFNQEQGTAYADRARARSLAEAGLRYADAMLTYSPQGADWRPPFRPYDPATYDATNPDTWPIPPVWFSDGTCSPNALGPDGVAFTDDDYYMEEETRHAFSGLVNLAPPGPPGPTVPFYERIGFTRYPDPSNAGQRGDPAHPGPLAGAGLDQLDLGQGHFLLRITYSPNPPYRASAVAANGNLLAGLEPDPLSKYLKIESVGVSAGTSFVWQALVAYKAIGLTDHILWVTDKENTGKPVVLGFGPWIDLDNSGRLDVNGGGQPAERRGDFLVTRYEGPMRFNSSLDLRGDNADAPPAPGSIKDESLGGTQIDLITQPLGYSDDHAWRPRGGGYLRDDTLESQHNIQETSKSQDNATPPGTITAQSCTVNFISAWGISQSHTLWGSDDPHFSTYRGRVLDNTQGFDSQNFSRYVDPLPAPDLFATDPATGVSRYYALTRDSGPILHRQAGSGTSFSANAGRYGHGPGIYVDNFADLQFVESDGSHNLELLLDDLLGNLPRTDPRALDSGWNAVRTMYAPKGLQVTLYRSEEQLLQEEGRTVADIETSQTPASLAPNQIWWPGHVAGEPGIKLVRHDGRWRIADPNTPDSPVLGDDANTNVMFLDYPKPGNQVLLAEGNIRIQGQLPPDLSRTGRYNLTVVSGGTIYIDGQILTPQDVQFTAAEIAAHPGLPATGGRFTEAKGTGLPDEMNSSIALLARDCVVVNPTQLVPQLTQGLVTAQPDDSTTPLTSGQHWELAPSMGGSIYSRWRFGEPPITDVAGTPTPNLFALAAYQTGADPGPAAIALRIYNAFDNLTGNYDFDPNPAGTEYSFYFLPEGTGSSTAWIEYRLSPHWARLVHQPTGAADPDQTVLPWSLSGAPPAPLTRYVTTDPGSLNALEFRYANPGLGTGATNYWLKRFKIEEFNPDTGWPMGALHAKVNALMYAQDGCFFVIPGQYFDANARPNDPNSPAVRYRRYNYDLEIRGAIAENFHAPAAAWRQWQDLWAYPQYFDLSGTPALAWGTVRYHFDETLRAPRAQSATHLDTTTGQPLRYADNDLPNPGINLPKLPLLPTCPGLIYRGAG